MILDDPLLFSQAGEELLPHLQHTITLYVFGGDESPDMITVACDDCNQVLVSFLTDKTADHSATSEPSRTSSFRAMQGLLAGCRLLIQQYDSVLDFQLGGNLTNRPFLMIRDALRDLKVLPGPAPPSHGHSHG